MFEKVKRKFCGGLGEERRKSRGSKGEEKRKHNGTGVELVVRSDHVHTMRHGSVGKGSWLYNQSHAN
jgi:hypothetical protein